MGSEDQSKTIEESSTKETKADETLNSKSEEKKPIVSEQYSHESTSNENIVEVDDILDDEVIETTSLEGNYKFDSRSKSHNGVITKESMTSDKKEHRANKKIQKNNRNSNIRSNISKLAKPKFDFRK